MAFDKAVKVYLGADLFAEEKLSVDEFYGKLEGPIPITPDD